MNRTHNDTEPNSAKTFHILLAEDDTDDFELFKEALAQLSFKGNLIRVEDGQALIDRLLKNDQLPDIIFLDINMPKKNGIQCLLELKQHSRLAHIPVIMISTSFNDRTLNELYMLGAQHAIAKPTLFSLLTKLISFVISFALKETDHQVPKNDFLLVG